MSEKSGLTVRQHVRQAIELPVAFEIEETHGEQVRFSARSEAVDRHLIRGASIDISPGGLGVSVCHFVPRNTVGTVRIIDPDAGEDGVVFEHVVRVRRVQMTSREPTYFVGFSFVDPDSSLADRIASLARFSSDGEVA